MTSKPRKRKPNPLPAKFRNQPLTFELPSHNMSLKERRAILADMLRLERLRFEYYHAHEELRQDHEKACSKI